MMRYSTEPRFRKYVKGYGFLLFPKNFRNKYGKKLMGTATKTGMLRKFLLKGLYKKLQKLQVI